MTVRVEAGGRTATARESYLSFIGSGEPADFLPETRRALRDAGEDPAALEANDIVVVVDGALFYSGRLDGVTLETGSADQGGFGFGGLDARLEVLNYGYTADRSFTVRQGGSTEYGQPAWTTTVDGEVVEEGEFRPFMVKWESGGGASEGWF